MMDNQMYNVPTDLTGRHSVVMDGIVPHRTMNSLVQSYSSDLNHQSQSMALAPVLSSFPGEPIMESHSEFNGTNGAGIVESNPLITSQRRHNVRDSSFISSSFTDNTVFQATPHSAASLATLLAARGSLQENLNNLAISGTPVGSSQAYVSNDCSNNSNSLFATSVNCGYDEILGSISSQWEINKYAAPSELGERTSVRTGFQPYSSTGNLDPNVWLSSNGENAMTYHSYSSCKFSNELALTLATSSPSIVGGVDIRNQCSGIGSSGMAHPSLNQTRFGSSEQNSCNSEELSLSFGSCKPPQLSQVICGSRYLHVVQEILFDMASYSLENLDLSSFSSARIVSENADSGDSRFEVQKEPALQKQEIKTKKSKLLTLLQMLDDCYNQCVDEIHTVVSAFHAATETDPHIHARFALQTISVLYKNLRERISTHFLAMTANSNPASPTESERSFEIHKQLALQHKKKKEHQIWRPQRGLPERSVSVLRAWMFQNFLHPYPKDAEKHVLAVKSGLTRNQVSNWFINARVRLWKPMIEEMYSEMNRRKTRQSDNTERNNRSHHHNISINHHKFGVN